MVRLIPAVLTSLVSWPTASDVVADSTLPWSDLFPRFAESVAPYQEASSRRRYQVSGKSLLVFFGSIPISEITEEMIESFVRTELAKGKAPATVNRETSCLHHSLKVAHSWRLIERVPEVRHLREPPGRTRYLNPEEVSAILQEVPPWVRPPVVVGVSTGMRLGELAALRWDQVHLEKRFVVLTMTKTHRTRSVPLNETALDCLRGIPRTLGRPEVFTQNGKPILPLSLSQAFKSAVRRAGLDEAIVFHSLRHTVASYLVMAGVEDRVVQQVMGWRSPAMVARYAHLAPEKAIAASAKIDGVLEGIRQPELPRSRGL